MSWLKSKLQTTFTALQLTPALYEIAIIRAMEKCPTLLSYNEMGSGLKVYVPSNREVKAIEQ